MCSCTTTRYYSLESDYNKEFRNSTKNEIIRACGVPTRTVSMNNGEYVMVYERYATYTFSNSYSRTNANARANANSNSTSNYTYANANAYGNSRNYSNSNSQTFDKRYFTEFYMNKYDKCYSVRTTDVYAKQEYDRGSTIAAILMVGGSAALLWLLVALKK